MNLSFRAATTADIPALHALVESAYRGMASREGWTTEADLLDGQRTDPDALEAIITTDRSAIVMAEDGDELVACCQLEQRDSTTAYVGMVAVRPARQAAGVGRALLAEAERLAASDFGATATRMTVISVRTELIAWYERLGYERTGETEPFPYGNERFGLPRVDDLDFVVLQKNLAIA